MRLNWAGQCFVRSCFLGYVILFPARAKLFNNRETDFFSLAHIFSYCYQQSISHKTSSFVYSKSVETVSHCVSVCMCVVVCVCAHACMTFWNQSKKKGCRKGDLTHRFVEKCKSNLKSLWVLCLAFRTLKKWRNEFMKKISSMCPICTFFSWGNNSPSEKVIIKESHLFAFWYFLSGRK